MGRMFLWVLVPWGTVAVLAYGCVSIWKNCDFFIGVLSTIVLFFGGATVFLYPFVRQREAERTRVLRGLSDRFKGFADYIDRLETKEIDLVRLTGEKLRLEYETEELIDKLQDCGEALLRQQLLLILYRELEKRRARTGENSQ